jgi:phosphoserine aminotransferase
MDNGTAQYTEANINKSLPRPWWARIVGVSSLKPVHRVINFGAGPAAMPVEALERARDELLDFGGSGMSVMELSHRSAEYGRVHEEALALVRELLEAPPEFKILLLQGGGHLQFAMLPMNVLFGGRKAGYIISGHWAKKAWQEARAAAGAGVSVAASTEAERFARLPRQDELHIDPDAAYVHFTSNNTIYGSQWHEFPETGGVPLASDMSSDIMWRPFNVRPFGLVYAGAQKNLGPAGVTLVIIREDFLARCRPDLPSMLRYGAHVEKNSLYNTPPSFAVYMLRNVLAHLKSRGGLPAAEAENRRKGGMLYSCLDRHPGFYTGHVANKGERSFMNAVFRLPEERLDALFVAEAAKNGMAGLKGYRDLGGIRVSMYNAVTAEQVGVLVDFMDKFAAAHG